MYAELIRQMCKNRYNRIYELLAGMPDREDEPKCWCQNNYLYNDIPYVDCPLHGVDYPRSRSRNF